MIKRCPSILAERFGEPFGKRIAELEKKGPAASAYGFPSMGCIVSDAEADRLIEKNVGDIVSVQGTIERTIMGVVHLEDCTIR